MTSAETPELAKGETIRLTVERMAHGGEGIAHAADGRTIFVAGAYPGDTVDAELTQLKKRFGRAQLVDVVEAGPLRVESSCPAAAAGAGCCDFATLDPEAELGLKAEVMLDQLRRLGKLTDLPDPQLIDVQPRRGWRTRVRLGVDAQGRAGLRKRGSHDLVTDVACTQLAPGLVDGLVGPGAQRFTPGSEVIAVLDADGVRHVVETAKPPRGQRVERVERVLEGSGTVRETADGHDFRFPATAFWQAHTAAPDAYAKLVRNWLSVADVDGAYADLPYPDSKRVAWDLYGGVGVFVPALAETLATTAPGLPAGATSVLDKELDADIDADPEAPSGPEVTVVSVDYSPAAAKARQDALADYDVVLHNDLVEKAIDQLPKPDAIVLDPPRTGAGAEVVEKAASASPGAVVHVGCDPATFARDLATWREQGYAVRRLAVINAFPGTHHMEALALLEPAELY